MKAYVVINLIIVTDNAAAIRNNVGSVQKL